MSGALDTLLQLASVKFRVLTEAEMKMLLAAVTGEAADCRSINKEENDLEKADQWKESRTINACVIRWLCSEKQAYQLIDVKGINLNFAKIKGTLDLRGINLNTVILLQNCSIPDGIDLRDARIGSFVLDGSHCGNITAQRAIFQGTVALRHGFRAKGSANFVGATITGDMDCGNGAFSNPNGDAINADRAKVQGAVFLRNRFHANGIVRLVDASIGLLDCENGTFSNPNGEAINMDRVKIQGTVFLGNGFNAHGIVRMVDASINGNLNCIGGTFAASGKVALNISRGSIGGTVLLRDGFIINGAVHMSGSKIGGDLDCSGGIFINGGHRNQPIILATVAHIGGSVLFDSIEERPFQTDGYIWMRGISIDAALSCVDARFLQSDMNGLFVPNARVGLTFIWKNIILNKNTKLDLSYAKVSQFEDDIGQSNHVSKQLNVGEQNHLNSGNLIIDGFVYDAIVGPQMRSSMYGLVFSNLQKQWLSHRIKWLELQPISNFSRQPYEQLATVLRRSGYEVDAKRVLFAKQEALRKHGHLGKMGRVGGWLLKVTIGHGFYSYLTFVWALLFWFLGTVIFYFAYTNGLLSPVKSDIPTIFDPIMYSLDTLLPIINFHQEEYWMPQGVTLIGYIVLCYFWLHIAVGWILTSLGVIGFTGLVRKE